MSRGVHNREYRILRRLLRELREAAGLTQTQVAEALGMHQSYVSKYETGERRLDVVELRRVAMAVGLSPTAVMRRLDKLLDG